MLSVQGDDRLKAVVLALRQARREVRSDLNRATRQTMNPVWREAVARRAGRHPLDRPVIAKGARIAPGNPPVAVAATSTRKLSGGLVPAEKWHAVEFGGSRDKVTTFERRTPSGGTTTVTRKASAQLPPRYRKGRVAFPALDEIAPRVVSLWLQLVVRTFNEAVEKGAR